MDERCALGRRISPWSAALLVLGALSAAPSRAQLALALEATGNPVRPAGSVELELTVSNTGASAVANVNLQLDVPVQVVGFNQNLNSANGSCITSGNLNVNCDGGETISWSLGTLGAGERKTVSLEPQVFSTLTDGTLVSFNARALEGATLRASASDADTVESLPSFELALDESADPVAPGDDLTYSATFSNVTGVSALGCALSFVLPSGTSFVSATGGGSFAAGVVTWNLGTLSAGKADTRQATLHVDLPVTDGALLHPTASIQASGLLSAKAETVSVVQTGSALQLEIEASPDPVRAAGTLEVQLTMSNTGSTTIDPVLELRLGTFSVGFADNLLTHGGVCTISGNVNTACDPRERVQWDVPPLGPGERQTVSLPPQVFSVLINGNTLPLHAELYEPLGGQVGKSRLARQTLVVHSTPVFELALDESADPVAPGGALTYTATYSNASGANALGTALTLQLPPNASFVSATGGGSFAGGVVTWNLGTLSPGKGNTQQVIVHIDDFAAEGTPLRALAEIRDTALSPNSARAPAVTVVQSGSPLRLEIDASPDPVRGAGTLDVQLTASNIGSTTIDPVLELRLGTFSVSFNENLVTHGGVCTISGNLNTTCDSREILQWDLPPLAPGQHQTLSLPPQVFSVLINGNVLPLRAELYEPLGGQVGESRFARQSLLVHNTPTLELALDESADPVAPGDDLTYTATYSNVSGANTTPSLTLTLPAGTSFVSATGGGSFAGGVVTWSLGTLTAGQGDARQATVHVTTPALEGEVLRALAVVSDTAISANTARAPAVTVVQSGSPLRLEIHASPDPVRPAGTLDVQLTVSNAGNATIDPVLELRLGTFSVALVENLLTHGGVCTLTGNLNTTCDARELAVWDVPPLAPGERLTVELAPQVFSTLNSGNLLPLKAELYEPLIGQVGESRLARQNLLVDATPTFELALDDSPDSVALGGDITYAATFGNPTGAPTVGTTLALPLPLGTTFVSASVGGAFNNGAVTWNLGNVPAGRGGKRLATIRLGGGVGAGQLLRTVATIQDSANPSRNTARAPAVTAAQSVPELALAITATPNPAAPAGVLDVQYTATNLNGPPLSNVALEARVPVVVTFAQSSASGAADCTVSGNLNTNCDARERVHWTLPNLTQGAPVAVSIPPQVFGTMSNGNLIPFFGFVQGSQAVARQTVRIGIVEDQDGDGLSDWLDNCPFEPNTNQSDVGGIGAAAGPDGIGDACQCGDVSGNGRVTTADATLMTRSLLVPPTATLTRPDLCNVGGTTACTTADAVIVTRALLVPPTATVQQVCPAAQ